MVVDLDSSVLDRGPAAAAVLRAPTSNDAGLNKPGLVLTGNGKKTQPSFKNIYYTYWSTVIQTGINWTGINWTGVIWTDIIWTGRSFGLGDHLD